MADLDEDHAISQPQGTVGEQHLPRPAGPAALRDHGDHEILAAEETQLDSHVEPVPAHRRMGRKELPEAQAPAFRHLTALHIDGGALPLVDAEAADTVPDAGGAALAAVDERPREVAEGQGRRAQAKLQQHGIDGAHGRGLGFRV